MNVNIDLNDSPSFLNLRSTFCIKIIVKQKLTSREVLVRKFGEVGYTTIMASSEPLMLYRCTNEEMCIFIFI
jgi:formylmethanofuran dehydrogenase subunit A